MGSLWIPYAAKEKSHLGLAAISGALGLVLIAGACVASPTATSNPTATARPIETATSNRTATVTSSVTTGSTSQYTVTALPYLSSAQDGEGVWVIGTGSVTVAPDLALLTMGVSVQDSTVQQARDKAATAMDAMLAQLKNLGVADKDVQTQYFAIQPVYRYDMVGAGGQPMLVGYQVTNTMVGKIRDLSKTGQIIDAVVKAGGDSARIQGISFTVDDPASATAQATKLATQDAMAKAKAFADTLGVTLGKPVYVAQVNTGGAVARDFKGATAGAATPDVTTPIQSGELAITAQVQVVYAIAQ